jgi:hypothetical protein
MMCYTKRTKPFQIKYQSQNRILIKEESKNKSNKEKLNK